MYDQNSQYSQSSSLTFKKLAYSDQDYEIPSKFSLHNDQVLYGKNFETKPKTYVQTDKLRIRFKRVSAFFRSENHA